MTVDIAIENELCLRQYTLSSLLIVVPEAENVLCTTVCTNKTQQRILTKQVAISTQGPHFSLKVKKTQTEILHRQDYDDVQERRQHIHQEFLSELALEESFPPKEGDSISQISPTTSSVPFPRKTDIILTVFICR
ncbi:hypothetical protein NPIL_310591 [Nephila pilipes]|uniref:Uncharacterized protein n=1 Tax=Nephila pilipes TaxID=299642 RepID=A0A8X6TED6_NEPPI|nr:hypothetical protein NPIL_310591 [Nephila pilipes]